MTIRMPGARGLSLCECWESPECLRDDDDTVAAAAMIFRRGRCL
jgi:hypothetical protein